VNAVASASARCVVLGIGNPDRGDDAAGREVARLVRRILPRRIDVTEHAGEATDLLIRMEGAAAAFLVDACVSEAPAGTIWRFDAGAGPLPERAFGLSTHGFGVAEAIELARALDRLPPRCIVYAIEGSSFELGAPLSPQVEAAAADVARRLCAEITNLSAAWGERLCMKPR
jgi:hydrogenase maturation protease